MTKERFNYVVDVKNFQGFGGAMGLTVNVESDFELTDNELSGKAMALVVKEYDKLAHEYNDQNAYKKLMNMSGLKDLKKLDSRVVSIQHEVHYECNSDEYE